MKERQETNNVCTNATYETTAAHTKNLNKRQKDCLWKQRTHYGLGNLSLGLKRCRRWRPGHQKRLQMSTGFHKHLFTTVSKKLLP